MMERLAVEEGFVLGAVKGKYIIPLFAYYDGEGEWTIHENAKVYHSRKTMREGLREAKKHLPDGADDVHAFGVYLS